MQDTVTKTKKQKEPCQQKIHPPISMSMSAQSMKQPILYDHAGGCNSASS